MRSSVLSQKRIREKKKERNRAKKHVASNFISCFPLSVPSKRTLILPAGSHSHRTSPLTYTSLFLTVTESCFQKRYKVQEVQGCPSIYSVACSQGKYSSPYHNPLATQPHSCFTDILSQGVICPTPWSPCSHSPLHRQTCSNNLISVISQSPRRAAFLSGICKDNVTKCQPSRAPALQQELQQNWELIM